MAEQTTVLQLVLDQLEMGNAISTIDDRISIQKVVCLAQEAGLQLGYSFNWYVRGPYSPALASDYYQIASARSAVETDTKNFVLTDAAKGAIQKVRAIFNAPEGVALDQVRWLELVASIVFLVRRYKLSIGAAKEKIHISKPALYPYFDRAENALREAGFVME